MTAHKKPFGAVPAKAVAAPRLRPALLLRLLHAIGAVVRPSRAVSDDPAPVYWRGLPPVVTPSVPIVQKNNTQPAQMASLPVTLADFARTQALPQYQSRPGVRSPATRPLTAVDPTCPDVPETFRVKNHSTSVPNPQKHVFSVPPVSQPPLDFQVLAMHKNPPCKPVSAKAYIIASAVARAGARLVSSIRMVAVVVLSALLLATVLHNPDHAQQIVDYNLSAIFARSDDGGLDNAFKTVEVQIEEGATFGMIMDPYPLSGAQIRTLLQNDLAYEWLARRLQAGKSISVTHDDQTVTTIKYPIDLLETLVVLWSADAESFEVFIEKIPVAVQPMYVAGSIESAFYVDALKAGMPESLVVSVANVFQWDIDFVNNIRKGDSFKVLYQQEYLDEKALSPHKILVAEFINRGEQITAIAYDLPEEVRDKYPRFTGYGTSYYSPDGTPLRKAFLRMPLEFGRVSSSFNPNRLHPILGIRKAHRGTDYAAPRHTPILSVASGRVITVATGPGYGRYVVIDHGGGIQTLYAHMQKFQSGIKPGKRVRQGQTIGTVGTSGLSTGPHVHYEFRVHGVHKNPENVQLPNSPPLPDEAMPEFLQYQARVMETFRLFSQHASLSQGG